MLGFIVLQFFLIPVAWALILAHITWPAYMWLREALGGRASASALVMTALIALAFAVPMVTLMVQLTQGTAAFFGGIASYLTDNRSQVLDFVGGMPWFGQSLVTFVSGLTGDPSVLGNQVAQWSDRWVAQAAQVVSGIGHNAIKFGFAVLTLFFVYRDGENLLAQVKRAATPLLGARADVYLRAMGSVSRSVIYGIVLTAIAQSALAGIGYWVTGARAPMLLTILTLLVAFVPFGTPFVWAPVAISLLIQGHTWAGIGLFLWGTFAVSLVDNVIRPYVISSAAQLPYLFVIFGVLGGVAAFGMIGIFIGPFVVAMLLAAWREWQEEARLRSGDQTAVE